MKPYQVAYGFDPNPAILNYLRNAVILTEDQLYKLSLLAEARMPTGGYEVGRGEKTKQLIGEAKEWILKDRD